MTDYPEHEKLKALDGENDLVGAFIEWLDEQGYTIAKWGKPWDKELDCPNEMHGDAVRWRIAQCPRCLPEITFHGSTVAYEDLEEGTQRDPDGNIIDPDEPENAVLWHCAPARWYDGDYVCKSCRDKTCEQCEGTLKVYETRIDDSQLWPAGKSIEAWLSEYFGIDLKKLSEEKEAMYQTLKAHAEA